MSDLIRMMEQGGIAPSAPEVSEENEVNTEEGRYRLPAEKLLPPIMREIVTNAPQSRKTQAFVASLAPLCAMAPRVRLDYYYDQRPSALLLQVVIEGAQSTGKSYAADIERLIMNDTLKSLDKQQRRREQEYREKKKRRKANEKLEEEPITTVRVVPATISKTVLTKRADFYDRKYGDTLTFWMFAEELAQVTDAGKQGYSNLRTIMRTAYDLGSQFGMDFASDNSYSAIVDINICSMFCATPAAVDEYYDKKSIEGGNVTRCVLCRLPEDIGEDGALFKPYSASQRETINRMLQKLMDATYAEDGGLQPVVELDTSWLDATVKSWCKARGKEATKSGSDALNTFRKRSSVSAFRIASLSYYLYQLEGAVSEEQARKRSRQIYLYMADYILEGLLERWGAKYEQLNRKRKQENTAPKKPILFDTLSDPFTRNQLKLQVDSLGLTTPVRVFLSKWKGLKMISAIDKNTYKKTEQ